MPRKLKPYTVVLSLEERRRQSDVDALLRDSETYLYCDHVDAQDGEQALRKIKRKNDLKDSDLLGGLVFPGTLTSEV